MADVKISGLPASTVPLAGTEVLPIVQSTTTKQVSVANLTAGRTFDALGMTLTSTDAGASQAPTIDLYRDSASPAASDTIGEIEFNGKDSAANKQAYALLHGSILSPTSGAEQGQIHFETATAGALTEKMIIGTTNLVINEPGNIFNVRIEGDTDANLFYTDATNSRVGIGTTSPATKLDVNGSFNVAGAATLSPANAAVAISPTGTGTVAISPAGALTINPTAASTINNTSIGASTPSTGKFSTVETTGKVGIGAGVQSTIQLYVSGTGTDLIFDFGGTGGDVMYSGAANAGITAGENAGASILYVRKNTATSRSINAAGTVNASGTDYAEYMVKAGDFTIAKGDICGIDANGKLTNVFTDAVSFVVKSTNPSYVGGDTWGSEEALGLTKPKPPEDDATDEEKAQYATNKTAFDAALEAARQNVDRIAFCGQVPVNVTNATAGQYIIPVNDNGAIKGEAVSNPTFDQYQIAVGKVISVKNNITKIIVKIS